MSDKLPTRADLREHVAHELASVPDVERRVAAVARMLAETDHPDGPTDTRSHVGWRMRLLGRTATSTSSADDAIRNWITATLREFGLEPQHRPEGGSMTITPEHQALVTAAAKALSLMQRLGWRNATEAEGLGEDDMIEAVAAEIAYRELHDALPIPARFAAELIRDPLHDAKEAKA